MSNNKYENTVVKVATRLGSGTGFFISENLAITNFHVIEKHKEVALINDNKDRVLAKVIVADPKRDLALLKTEESFKNISPLNFRTSDVNTSDQVTAVGFPFGRPLTQTRGVISSTNQPINNLSYYMVDAAINPGNSGGPILDSNGDVIGVTTLKFTQADNMGFALPASEVQSLINSHNELQPKDYTVLCPQCSSSLHADSEDCLSCGYEFDKEAFYSEVQPTKLELFVEAALSQAGLNPISLRSGSEYWNFHSGSSEVRIFKFRNDYLFATSPLVKLPNGDKLRAAYEYVLSYDKKPYFLSIKDDEVFLSYRIHLSDIENKNLVTKLQKDLANFLQEADDMDNFLINNYDCQPSSGSLIDKLAS